MLKIHFFQKKNTKNRKFEKNNSKKIDQKKKHGILIKNAKQKLKKPRKTTQKKKNAKQHEKTSAKC